MNLPIFKSPVADEFYSREGYLLNFHDERWKLNKDVEIPVSALADVMDGQIYLSLLHVLAFFAKTSSPSHVQNMFYRFKHYVESTLEQPVFSVESLVSYRSQLDKKTEWYLGALRVLIRKWVDLGYAGVPDNAISILDKWRIKGNEKGRAVQSMCPESGPLTDIEMEALVAAIVTAYSQNKLTLIDTCYSLTVVTTGRRPIQITALKVKDLSPKGERHAINFPRGKQRNQGWRTSFKKFYVLEDLWLLLQQQGAAVKQAFAEKLKAEVPMDLVSELPLFPVIDAIDLQSDLMEQLSVDRLHAPSDSVGEAMNRIEKVLKVISERTGMPIHLNPTRFRYTLGTNLAREGKGEYVIAEALDHSDTQNSGVYVRNIPEIVERIDKAVAMQLAPIAQAFQGVLVASERDARRGDDPGSRVSNGSANLGTCGSYGFCSALAPAACYTCNHFQPWLYGPHESVLDSLIQERDKILEETGDRKIASVNDRLILAVSDVVYRCQVVKNEVGRG